ncbi:MAG: hypothetical protein GY846_11240, partial [Deltaproteobacteria bacterium]|nr:hypothetical protein [Deltaproteobacteria bacterium]
MKNIEGLKDEEIIQGLLQIGKHAHIAAHIPGRIRLKISMEGVKALNNGNGNNCPQLNHGLRPCDPTRFYR